MTRAKAGRQGATPCGSMSEVWLLAGRCRPSSRVTVGLHPLHMPKINVFPRSVGRNCSILLKNGGQRQISSF